MSDIESNLINSDNTSCLEPNNPIGVTFIDKFSQNKYPDISFLMFLVLKINESLNYLDLIRFYPQWALLIFH